jgi:predicted Ser/Thr protein kinase
MSDAAGAPREIGRYRLDGMLGQGAMGTVYRARDTLIERAVALKTVRRDIGDAGREGELIERFRKEAQAAGRLMHPNIVAVYDYGETADLAYIAMEFVDGTALSALIGERPCALPRALDWFSDLLAGLDYAHAHGVVHRDIKPANLLVTRDGRVKISDFGIARIESSTLTQIGTMLGTPSYMSPEQFRGDAVDGRSDLFSAAIVLYQMLTGQRPFSGSSATVMQQVLNHTPAPPSTLNAALSPAFDDVVMRALAKAPHERHGDARAFQRALADALDAAHAADATVFAGRAAPAAPDDATIMAPRTLHGARTGWAERPLQPLQPMQPVQSVRAGVAAGAATTRGGATAGGGATLPDWLQHAAPELEAVLTRQVGPMARLLLRRVAQSASDFDGLADALLAHIPSPQARAMFERQVTEIRTRHLPPTRTGADGTAAGAAGAGTSGGGQAAPAQASALAVTPAQAAALTPLLAAAIGPIAAVVVKRALHAPCSRAEFVARLAAHIEADGARARFLDQAAGMY